MNKLSLTLNPNRMKKLLSLTIFLFICISTSLAQSRDVRQLDYFNKVESGGSFNVFIKQGDQEKVVIEAESGPIDKIITEIDDNTLKIKTEDGNWWSFDSYDFKGVNIYITFTELHSISGSGSGNVRLESAIRGDDISIRSSGSGSVYCESTLVAGDDLSIVNSGSGEIKIMDAISASDETSITNSGSGDIEIYALTADELSINNSGSGGVQIEGGKTDSQSIRLSGSGNMKMENLASNRCEIRKSGSGSVYVSVTEELSGSSSGSGNVYVKNGRPRIDFNFSGSGKIKYL